MVLPDVSVLVEALMPGAVEHERSRRWLVEALNGHETVCTWEPILCSVVRIATRSRVFDPPAPLPDALAFADAVRRAPRTILLQQGPQFWPIFEALVLKIGAGRNLITDAMIAALAIEHGCTLISPDRDFAKFPGLKWQTPT